MKTKLPYIAFLMLIVMASCTDPKKDGGTTPVAERAKTSSSSLSGSVMSPITVPIQARNHLRQQIRIINRDTQRRNQKMQDIQGRPGR